MTSMISDLEILARRSIRNRVDPDVPSAYFVEPEATADGKIEEVATLFLTNRECPFRCLYCDLWKNTTETSVPVGAIPRQIDHALARLPGASHIKLYNSGNFFDAKAIPPDDHVEIARRVARFRTVIVENHPRLVGQPCLSFLELLRQARRESTGGRNGGNPAVEREPEFEIAMGLETVHPQVLPRLNKQMTADDFQAAAGFLRENGVSVRAFILLQPPYMPPGEAVDWALRSLEFAFESGARAATVIPTRAGNGIVDELAQTGDYQPPRISQLERVLESAIPWGRGRVFVDLWDVERFFECPACGPRQVERLHAMNLRQTILPGAPCEHLR